MNTKTVIIALALIANIFFTSCDKVDEIALPVVAILELGEGDTHGTDHTAVIGGELHAEVEVVAEGTIDYIQVIIHPEGDHDENEAWELDTIYTKFSGLKNTTFHEHIDIDSIAEAGDYHFDFIVTDMDGCQGSAEADLLLTVD